VEWDNIPEGQEALTSFMEESGYIKIGAFDFKWTRDISSSFQNLISNVQLK
jgi:hypothetical protein